MRHSDIVGWGTWGTPRKRGRKEYKSQSCQGHQNQVTWSQRGSQRLNRQPENLHRTDPWPIRYSYVT